MMKSKNRVLGGTRILASFALLLSLVGLVFIYSASSVFALEKYGSAHYFVLRQFMGLCLGIVGAVVLQVFPAEFIKKASPYAFLASLMLTILTLTHAFSRHVHGSSRWVRFGSFAFQPGEVLKVSLLVYLAYILSKKDWAHAFLLTDYMPLLAIIALPCLVALAQPDFGLAATLVLTTCIMLFLASVRVKHLAIGLAALIPLGVCAMIAKPYRLKRILVFLNPWADPVGSGFQIIQSLIAIGSGGFWGVGIGNSRQKFFYLPMQHTDFVFSVIAEETGFIGATALVSMYLVFLYLGMRVARDIDDPCASLVVAGFSCLTGLQAFINIAVTTGLVPTKGLGLPFVSYGSTALVCNICMVGVILNFAREHA